MSAVVVVQTAFLGDCLLGIPLLKGVRKKFPQSKLIFVCRRGVGDFFTKSGLVDAVFEIQKGKAKSYNEVLHQINSENVEAVFVPHESVRTLLFARQIECELKIGFKKISNLGIFQHRIKKDKTLPDAVRQLSLLSPLDENLSHEIAQYSAEKVAYKIGNKGQLSTPPEWGFVSLRTELRQNDVWPNLAERLKLNTSSSKKRVLIFPGSVWETKKWSADGFVQVASELAKSYDVFFAGGPDEIELCESLHAKCPGAQNIAGLTSIFESAVLISHSDLVIGNDSAPAHLAALAETKSITMFGPTVIEFGYRPWGKQSYVIQVQGLECRPCGPHGHKVCPRKTHECMKNISYQQPLELAQSLLE